MNEKLQINKVLKGDTSAFSYFVQKYQDMAMTIAYRICGNIQDAEDIVQNAFVKTFHNLHAFKSQSKFSTWFYRIVYNTALTETSNAAKKLISIELEQINSAELISDMDILRQIEEKELKSLVNEAMRQLPNDEGLILSLFYLEENSIKDITGIIGITESNVKVKLHRARKRIAVILKNLITQ